MSDFPSVIWFYSGGPGRAGQKLVSGENAVVKLNDVAKIYVVLQAVANTKLLSH